MPYANWGRKPFGKGSSLFTVGKAQPSGGAGLAFTALRAASGKEKGPEAMGALPAV